MVLKGNVKKILWDLLSWVVSTVGLILSGYIVSNFFAVPVNADAGYYIPVAKEILMGATPTVDVVTLYMPLVSYFYAFWIWCFGSNYNILLTPILILHISNTGLLYIAMGFFRTQRIIKILLCFSYFYTIILCDGMRILLEPFQVFFVLLAYISYIYMRPEKWIRYALTGLLLGMSILSKQFSCVYGAAFIIMVLFSEGVFVKRFTRICNAFTLGFFHSSHLQYLLFLLRQRWLVL
jgi:hypothetical protein